MSDNQSDNSDDWGVPANPPKPRLLHEHEVPFNQLREQIDLRRSLIRQMVGRLYPAILQDEIDRLLARLREGK